MRKILRTFNLPSISLTNCLQVADRVRLTGKIFRNKDLAAVFRGWKDWTICEIVNSGQRKELQSACATHTHLRRDRRQGHQSLSSFSWSFYVLGLLPQSELVTGACEAQTFQMKDERCGWQEGSAS